MLKISLKFHILFSLYTMNLLKNWEKNQKPWNLKFKKDLNSEKKFKWLFAESEKNFQGKKCLTYVPMESVWKLTNECLIF